MENLKPAIKMSGGVRVHRRQGAPKPSAAVGEPIGIGGLLTEKTTRINQKIARMPEVNFIKLRDVIAHGVATFGDRLVRDLWCDREMYREFRADKTAWLMRKLFCPSDNVRIKMAENIGPFILRAFKLRGQQLILSFVDSIDSILVERPVDMAPETSVDAGRFSKALEFFGLGSADKRISFATIRQAYDKMLETNASRDQVNEEFMYLRDNYQAYLTSHGLSA
jgi:hypothetical protein